MERLAAINISVELHGNYPWVYLYSINGNRVIETYQASHGFTAFIQTATPARFSDRSKVFNLIRKYTKG